MNIFSPTCRLSRRNALLASLAGAALGPRIGHAQPTPAARPGRSEPGLRVKDIRRTAVKVPYRAVPARNMARELPHWKYFEIFEVELASGHVGIGETLLWYTYKATVDQNVAFAKGKNAAAIMWDDELGAGLQMALFDAVARAMDVPVHALLGKRLVNDTPLGWWDIDLPPEDVAAEAKTAAAHGYLAFKTKGRPWFDIWEQAKQGNAASPEGFSITFDYNDTLLDAERGIPILKAVEQHPITKMVETPIPQRNVPDGIEIKRHTRAKVAHHFGNPPALVALRNPICDGFVIGGGASRVMQQGAVAAMADMPFWLQIVGSSITAAWSLHFGAVNSHATWPAVNCHQLYTETLLEKPIIVKQGRSAIPDGPGLGYELDRQAIARLQIDKPTQRPNPPRLLETRWPDGRRLYVANGGINFMLRLFMKDSNLPYFEPGVTTSLLLGDGTKDWRELFQQAKQKPVLTKT
ncbi:MAG: mandelate racemase/muconate lactonizing enzyme family protein [Verrucomicrobiota bacterium]|nr:mandelate racemase/muconate lactonizing enzyme family protein [Verrucomicrobiota bacterium]